MRCQADEKPGDERSHEREQKDAAIDADVGRARQSLWHEPEEQVDAPEARKEAGRAADECQDASFDEQARITRARMRRARVERNLTLAFHARTSSRFEMLRPR